MELITFLVIIVVLCVAILFWPHDGTRPETSDDDLYCESCGAAATVIDDEDRLLCIDCIEPKEDA